MTLLVEIRIKLSQQSRRNGEFGRWLADIANTPSLARHISMTLLREGELCCEQIDEHAYRGMLGAVVSASGLGKGVFVSTLRYMPQAFARAQLKLWAMEQDLSTVGLDAWQSVIDHATSQGRMHLCYDALQLMTQHCPSSAIVDALMKWDLKSLEQIPQFWAPYRSELVRRHCMLDSFSSAMCLAGGNERLEASVRREIGMRIGSPNHKTWPDVLAHMAKGITDDVSEDTLVYRHRSAAVVVIDQVLGFDDKQMDEQLKTDDIRIIAYKLGLTGAVKKLEGLQAMRQAVEHDFGL